jgi:hypothetical protein
MRTIKAIFTVAFVLVACLDTTHTSQTTTTGATCIYNENACRLSVECCSQWCVNNVCEMRQP